MILNILLIIVVIIVFYRIIIKTYAESYENPFIYDSKPIIDINKLPYTPMPYIPSDNNIEGQNNINTFKTNNNQLIKEYADDSNFIIDDPSVKNVKILSFVDKSLITDDNKCLDIEGTNLTKKTCNSQNNTQKWSLIDDHIINKSQNKSLTINGNNIELQTTNNSTEQEWIPDTNSRIHSLKDYNKCLDILDNKLIINLCNNSVTQQWHNN
jgi:hypothetical protein